MAYRSSGIAVFVLLVSPFGFAQAPAARPASIFDFNALARPPIPADSLELVTGAAQPVQDAQQRIAAIGLLEKAHALSNIRAQPYDLKTTFLASGGLSSDGNWTLEDMSRGRKYRWTANGPNYSGVNLYPEGTANGLYGNQPNGTLPLRLIQVRSAIWFIYPTPGPQASIRTAAASLNGTSQTCVLVTIGAGTRTFSGGRNWEESEYCMDAATGLLSQYSPVPGLYVRYDYSSGIHFHNTIVPTSFTIFQNGRAVVEARTESAGDPPAATDAVFDTAGLAPLGSGREMNPAMNTPFILPVMGRRVSGGSASMQVVALHGNLAPDGTLSEVEILASTDPTASESAVNQAGSLLRGRVGAQPGATKQSSEVVLTFGFITPGR